MTVTLFEKTSFCDKILLTSIIDQGGKTFVPFISHVVGHLEPAKLRCVLRVGSGPEDFDVGGGTLVLRELLVVHGGISVEERELFSV